MALSIGGSKQKQSGSSNQTSTTTLSPDAKNLLQQRLAELKGQSYEGLNPADIAQFNNPYQQEVINATTADITAARDEEANMARAAALARGGGATSDRRGVREAELAGRYDRTLATTIGGLRASGYNTATGVAQTENSNKNAFGANLQAQINQLLSLLASETTTNTTGSSRGNASGLNFGFSKG